MCDEILKQAVEGISDLITTPGTINIDFADIRAVLENAGTALMGIGYAQGEKRAEEAAKAAINSPLLDISTNGAKGVLFSIAGGDDLTMFEIQDAAKVITESVDPNAKIIFGTVRDEKLKKGEIKITVIASSFPETVNRKSLFQGSDERMVDPVMTQPPRGKIFNGFTAAAAQTATTAAPEPKEVPQQQSTPKQDEPKKIIDDSDDDWGAVPAFLRRSKIK
jgi:cell division protein FtsZ